MFGFLGNKKQDVDSPPSSPNEDNSYIQALHPAPTSDSKPFDETDEMNNNNNSGSSKMMSSLEDNMSCISEAVAASSSSKQRSEEDCMPMQTQSTEIVNNVDCSSKSSSSKSSFKNVIENNMIAKASEMNVNNIKLETFQKTTIEEEGGTKNKPTVVAKLDDLKVNLDDVLNATTTLETEGSLDVFSDGHSIDGRHSIKSESTTSHTSETTSSTTTSKASSIKSGVASITKSIQSVAARSTRSNKSDDKSNTNKSIPSIQMSEAEASEAYNKICCPPPNLRYSPYPGSTASSSNNEPSASLKDIRAKYRDTTVTPTSLASEISDSLASTADSCNKSIKSDDNDTAPSGAASHCTNAHSVYSAAGTERMPRNEKREKKKDDDESSSVKKKLELKTSLHDDNMVGKEEEHTLDEETKVDEEKKEDEENVVVANFMSESSGQSSNFLWQGSSKFSLSKLKQRKSKRFFGNKKSSTTSNVPIDPIGTSTRLCDLPIHVNSIDDGEEVELLYGSVHSLPKVLVDTTKEKKDGDDIMTRVASNQTAPTVETKEELLDDHHQEVVAPAVPLTVSRSEYDDDDGGLFGKLLSCSAIPMMGAATPKCNDINSTMSRSPSVTPSPLVLYNDEEDETLDVEIFEDDNNVTRIGYFKHPTIPVNDEQHPADEEQARSNTDNEVNDTQKMKVTSKIILKTKVVPGFEVLSAPNTDDDDVVIDTVSVKIDDIATKLNDRKLSGNLDGSLRSKRGNGLRMKLFKREKDKKNAKNKKKTKGVLNQLEINHVVDEKEGQSLGDVAKEEEGQPELKQEMVSAV